MAGIVLVVAGLTAGDGGPGIGADAAPVRTTLRLDIRWEGEGWVNPFGPVRVSLEKERLSVEIMGWNTTFAPVAFQPDGRVTNLPGARFTYSPETDRLTIRCGGDLFTLRPAAPPKP
jgi:hypothetical protein